MDNLMTKYQNIIEHEEEISLLFENARIKIDEIDKQAKKEKKNIVKDLARDLERKIRPETICIEIINQLRGRVSERFIRECLEDKYKQQFRVENAKKQKALYKAEESCENLAALTPLKPEELIPIQSSQAGSIEGKEEAQLSLTSGNTQAATSDNKVAGQNRVDDVKECPSCRINDLKYLELTEALSRQTTPATVDKISEYETELIIPKEKYKHLNDAMNESRDFIFIIFGKSGVFESVVPDTFRRKQTRVS